MNTNYLNYKPVGPLCYLLMDDKGYEKLGLFLTLTEKTPVLIMYYKKSKYVFKISFEELDSLMRCNIKVADLLLQKTFATFDNKPIHTLKKWLITSYIKQEFNEYLNTQKHSVIYPDYYYIYKNHFNKIVEII